MKRDLLKDMEITKRATPGPWDEIQRKDNRLYVGTKEKPIADVCNLYGTESEANLQFIAQAREGWPHAIERAIKAEALVRELLEVMMSVAYQECGYEENGITKFDSMAIGARMELLLTLIEHGRLEEINSFGRRVIAKLPGAKEVLGDE